MGYPSAEPLPWSAELPPCFLCQVHALLLVAVEHVVELTRRLGVDDDGILLIVKTQAARVEVGTANGAEAPVDHHYLRVVESWLI